MNVSPEFREAVRKELKRQRRVRAKETTPQARQNYVVGLRDDLDTMINRLNRMVGGLRQASSNPRLGFSDPDQDNLARAAGIIAKAIKNLDTADNVIDRVFRA